MITGTCTARNQESENFFVPALQKPKGTLITNIASSSSHREGMSAEPILLLRPQTPVKKKTARRSHAEPFFFDPTAWVCPRTSSRIP